MKLCSWCGCHEATEERDGLAICAECLKELEERGAAV